MLQPHLHSQHFYNRASCVSLVSVSSLNKAILYLFSCHCKEFKNDNFLYILQHITSSISRVMYVKNITIEQYLCILSDLHSGI